MSAEEPAGRSDDGDADPGTAQDDARALAEAEAALAAAPEPASEPVPVPGPAPAAEPGWGLRLALALALVALVFVAFAPVLGAGFVNWDDDRNFVDNPHWRGITAANLGWMFTEFHMAHWHPLTWISLAIDHTVFNGDPAGLHVMNVVWHALCALAVFGCARFLFRRAAPDAEGLTIDLAAFFASAFFAVHPLRAESVAWVTERRDVLSGLFFFLSLGSWLRYTGADDPRARKKAWTWSLVWFVAAGLSKVAVFVLPILLVVLDLWPLRRRAALGWGGLLREKWAHIAVAAVLIPIAIYGQGQAASMYSLAEHPLDARVVQAGVATYFYPRMTLWPAALTPMYELPPQEAMFSGVILVRALIGAGVALLALLLYRVVPALSAAWLCFLITIAPVSGLTQAGSQIAADRYSYLACVSLAFLAAGGLFLALRRKIPSPWPATAIAVVATGALVWRCNAQSSIWTTSERLWTHTLQLDPLNTVGLSNLAEVRLAQSAEETDPKRKVDLVYESIALLGRAYEINSDPSHRLNLAAAIRKLADYEPEKFDEHVGNAWKELEEGFGLARQRGTPKPAWHRMRAELLSDLNRWPESLKELQIYLQLMPEDVEGHLLYGMLLAESNKPEQALQHLAYARAQRPTDVRVWASLGLALGKVGRKEESRQAWQRVIDIQTDALGASAGADAHVQIATEMLKQFGGG